MIHIWQEFFFPINTVYKINNLYDKTGTHVQVVIIVSIKLLIYTITFLQFIHLSFFKSDT